MLIFQGFRRLVEALQALASALEVLVRIQGEAGPALDRLEVLERERHNFEAQCEGMLLKADGKLKAAANAEARERQIKKANDRTNPDPFPDDGEQGAELAALPADYAPTGETPGVRPVRLALAPSDKEAAIAAKFGI